LFARELPPKSQSPRLQLIRVQCMHSVNERP
jgi:hypothetical protein